VKEFHKNGKIKIETIYKKDIPVKKIFYSLEGKVLKEEKISQ